MIDDYALNWPTEYITYHGASTISFTLYLYNILLVRREGEGIGNWCKIGLFSIQVFPMLERGRIYFIEIVEESLFSILFPLFS